MIVHVLNGRQQLAGNVGRVLFCVGKPRVQISAVAQFLDQEYLSVVGNHLVELDDVGMVHRVEDVDLVLEFLDEDRRDPVELDALECITGRFANDARVLRVGIWIGALGIGASARSAFRVLLEDDLGDVPHAPPAQHLDLGVLFVHIQFVLLEDPVLDRFDFA